MLTFWYEFASTYSALSALRIGALAERAGIAVTWQPFLLGPIFAAQGWNTSPFNIYPAKGRYMWRDMARRMDGLGLGTLNISEGAFPQNGLTAARIAMIGLQADWGQSFTRACYRAQFLEARDIGALDTLASILTELGLDSDTVIARAKEDALIKTALREATERAQALGLFGAPSFTTSDGELFWGDDRLEEAIDWQVKLEN